jgi:hypothetical protein
MKLGQGQLRITPDFTDLTYGTLPNRSASAIGCWFFAVRLCPFFALSWLVINPELTHSLPAGGLIDSFSRYSESVGQSPASCLD